MNALSFYRSLSQPARAGLLVGSLLVVGATIAVVAWLVAPRHQTLFSNLRQSDAAEIVQTLGEWKVPYSLGEGGTSISVDEAKVYETRMRLVSAGIPKGGHVGFELFNESDFGVTEFAQKVNYQRALQGEIERTITSLPGVLDARVHLTIRRQGLFAEQEDGSKASVALSLSPGQSLSRGQLDGIRSLVAASVEGLKPEHVSVLDSEGALLSGGAADIATGGEQVQGERKGEVERAITTRVASLLGKTMNAGDFAVSVDATLNYDAVREVSERPVALGDQGSGLIQRRRTTSQPQQEGAATPRQEEDTEYVLGTTRQEVNRAPGRVERLSVAVVVPARLDEVELYRLRALVAAAAGMDFERGDQLEISRLGQGHATGPASAAAAADAGPQVSAPSVRAPAPPSVQKPAPEYGWRLIAAALLGVVATWLWLGLRRRQPARLTAQQREEALRKMRLWLQDGRLS
ncbi:flagellar basal-body MS-ring/collar protein FliF [Stenotrophomonas aracearum]|jgi:flagellar M-ring protein FliF|uniref:Flagellar M-ring protein n=1 Tax=Stenotrophomonas aracearum TaxID=3003272 RepID=A0ABY9YD24_9GAMM|nr:flagellar basal-body MS-ring/collar protein FliF [Stenotrophomonas sp. A5588]WNH48592.1 flagellar basal-body MS-ring/collar protein FliF [Stenotrophomonas sp. A5588]